MKYEYGMWWLENHEPYQKCNNPDWQDMKKQFVAERQCDLCGGSKILRTIISQDESRYDQCYKCAS